MFDFIDSGALDLAGCAGFAAAKGQNAGEGDERLGKLHSMFSFCFCSVFNIPKYFGSLA
jgi:hypothetical protein